MTHFYRKVPPNPKWPDKYDRVVVLVRDPFDALLAEFNRKHTKNHTGFASDEKFETEWLPYVTNSIEFWRGFHVYFKNQYEPHKVLFTKFENFHENLIGELQKVLHFLGFHMSEEIQKCVENRKEGLFHRKKVEIDQTKYYNAEQKIVLKTVRDEIYAKIGLNK